MKASIKVLGLALASVITFSMVGTCEAGQKVFANGRGIIHKGSCGGFPDVCKTPTPRGPIPYPNIAKRFDTAKGSKMVKTGTFNTKTNFKRSTGNTAGVKEGGPVVKRRGKAAFLNYSNDVKMESKNVSRLSKGLWIGN